MSPSGQGWAQQQGEAEHGGPGADVPGGRSPGPGHFQALDLLRDTCAPGLSVTHKNSKKHITATISLFPVHPEGREENVPSLLQ